MKGIPKESEMRSHGGLSIRHKLQGIVMLTSGVALLVASAAFTLYDRSTFLNAKSQDLNASAEMVGSNSTAALSFADVKSAREILAALQAKQNVVNACIYDKDGKVFATYSRDATGSDFSPPPAQPQITTIIGRNNMVLFRPITLNGESIGTIFIQADLADLHKRMTRFVEIASLVLLASLTVAFLLSSRLQRVISGPIQQLADTASLVAAHEDYSVRATKISNDEIGILFDQFNGMLDRIQQRDVALQQAHDGLEARVHERTRELQTEVGERKLAEQALEERKSFLNSLIENTPMGIVAIDSRGSVQMCNRAFEKLFLYRQQDLIGKTLFEVLSTPDLRTEMDSNRQQLESGIPTHLVTQRRRHDGSLVDVEAFSVPLGGEGHYTGAVLLYQDITERKRGEEALKLAKETAEAGSRAKSEFLANMSHEIRTPMNGILGMTELVLDTELDGEQRNYLNLAKVSADSLLSLINDILDYSKIEAGKLEVEAIDFNLGDSLGDTMKTLSLRAHQKGLELAFEIKPDVPDGLVGDPGRLRQIIVNLVGNAVKFTEQGEVVLYVETESRTQDDIHIHFTVADTGIGIAPEKQAVIFEAFNQADGSMTRKYGGTGLGLTISSRLLELMGGRIWVESESGHGSRFHFIVRFGLQKLPTRNVVPRDPIALRDMRVLVVDDNATNRQILLKMLETWHTKPTAVESGARAMVTLREAIGLGREFPLILIDAQMPEMDGFALAEAIKRNPDWRTATVMMLSSAGQRGDAIRCRELGVAAYLTKPVRQIELLDAILIALGTRAENKISPALVTRHTVRESRNRLHILLVEDNAVNQLVALRLLEKYGHTVGVAANGKKALEALDKGQYDVVLMDVQMPEMNGWEATQAIRQKEMATGMHIPIVAMTAHAMKGDEERCRAAGMDAYLTKPIHTQELISVLENIGDRRANVPGAVYPSLKKTTKSAVDLAGALERLDGDRTLFDELTQLFRNNCPRILDGMRHAIAMHDAKNLESFAHTLKGSSASLGAIAVAQAAGEIERLARTDNMESTHDQFIVLQEELDRLFSEIEVLHEG
jgi:two-component system, sensor histidine kinase and response regulator